MSSTRQGSVAVLALIMVVSTSALAIAMISLSGALRTKSTRLENQRVVQNAFDGGVDVARDMAARGVLRMPQTVNLTIGSVQESLTLTDVSSLTVSLLGITITTGAPTILVSGSLSFRGSTYKLQRVIGRGRASTVWQYALYVNGGILTLNSVQTGSAGLEGSAWFAGSVTFLNGATHFGGDLTSTGVIVGGTVDGITTQNAQPISFPSLSGSTYQSAAASILSGGTTLNGYTFTSADANGYPLVYVNGDLNISGSFSGSGVIYAVGNVTISGNISVGGSDHLVIITPQTITLSTSALSVNAYLFAGTSLSVTSAGQTRTLTSGVVAGGLSLSDNISSSFDPVVRDNPLEAWKLKLPGVWP